MKEWDLEDGSISCLGENSGWMELDFTEAQLRVVEVSDGGEIACIPINKVLCIPADKVLVSNVISLDGLWSFHIKGPNVLKLEEWVYKTRDWDAMDKEEVTGAPGQVNSYTTIFEVAKIPDGEIRLVLDDLKQWIPSHVGFLSRKRSLEVYVNDMKAEALKPSFWQEKQFLDVRIDGLLCKGTNRITIHAISLLNPMHSLVEPVYLLGDFMLCDGRIFVNTGKISGYWSENGFPNYSGTGVYAKEFFLDENSQSIERLILELEGVRDGCKVRLNGREDCTRYWPPFTVDITQHVKQGLNTIEIEVFNTLENLYGRNMPQSGLSGGRIIMLR